MRRKVSKIVHRIMAVSLSGLFPNLRKRKSKNPGKSEHPRILIYFADLCKN